MALETEDRYVDLLLTTPIQTHSNHRVPLNFSQNASQPILKSTNGYQLSIIRFSLNSETLSIYIPATQSASTTIYSFTMEINGKQFQQFMQFEPQNLNPVDPDEHYFVYSYQFVVYLMNKCLASCLAGLSDLTIYTTSVPTLTFDPTSQKCTLNLNDSAYGFNESGKINIYLNNSLFALLANIPASIVNKNTLGMDYQINNLISQSPSALIQDYCTVALWSPVSSIIFTTNLIPIYQSQTTPCQIYENRQLVNNSSSFNYMNILTDFIANDLDFTPYIQYSASVYRYLSLKPNAEIRNIDLACFWQNKNTGKLKPLYLGPGGSASVKLFLSRI